MPKKATYVWWCGGWLAWNSAGIMLLHWRVWLFIFWVFFIVGVAVEFPLCFPTRPFSTSTICKHWLQSNVSIEITSFPKLLWIIKTKPPKRRQIGNDRTNSPKIKPNTGAQLQPTYYPFALSDFDSCWSVPHRALINWLVYGPWVSMYAAAASGRQTPEINPLSPN